MPADTHEGDRAEVVLEEVARPQVERGERRDALQPLLEGVQAGDRAVPARVLRADAGERHGVRHPRGIEPIREQAGDAVLPGADARTGIRREEHERRPGAVEGAAHELRILDVAHHRLGARPCERRETARAPRDHANRASRLQNPSRHHLADVAGRAEHDVHLPGHAGLRS